MHRLNSRKSGRSDHMFVVYSALKVHFCQTNPIFSNKINAPRFRRRSPARMKAITARRYSPYDPSCVVMPEYEGHRYIDMKRLLSLREGIAEASTLRRIAALKQVGVLDADQADYLTGAFSHITRLLLREQIADLKAGKTVGNFPPRR